MSDGVAAAGGGAPASDGGGNPEVQNPELQGRVDPPAKPKPDGDKPEGGDKKEPPKKKRYLDIDGQRVDEDELREAHKRAKSYDKERQELQASQKQMQAFIEALKSDPLKILSDPRLGIKQQEIAEAILRKQIEAELEEKENPHAKEIRERDAKIAEYAAREKAEKERIEGERKAALIKQRQEHLGKIFSEAMELTPLSKEPETAAETLREMALYFRKLKAEGEVPDPKQIAEHINNKRLKSFAAVARSMTGEDLIAFMGDKVVAEIRKADLARIRKGKAQPPKTVEPDKWVGRGEKEQPKKFIDPYESRINK